MLEQAPIKHLLVIDFDNTLINEHSHNYYAQKIPSEFAAKNGIILPKENGFAYASDPEKVIAFNPDLESEQEIKKVIEQELSGPKNPEKMKKLIKKALEHGHAVAIASFNNYPEVIKPTLEMLGLEREQIEQIIIVAGFPEAGQNSPERKEEHIYKAMEISGVKDPANVLLMDDSSKNIATAKARGHKGVLVPLEINPSSSYIAKASKFVNADLRHPKKELDKQRKKPLFIKKEKEQKVVQKRQQRENAQKGEKETNRATKDPRETEKLLEQKLQEICKNPWHIRQGVQAVSDTVPSINEVKLLQDMIQNEVKRRTGIDLKSTIVESQREPGKYRLTIDDLNLLQNALLLSKPQKETDQKQSPVQARSPKNWIQLEYERITKKAEVNYKKRFSKKDSNEQSEIAKKEEKVNIVKKK